jgi:hypothetical protein
MSEEREFVGGFDRPRAEPNAFARRKPSLERTRDESMRTRLITERVRL